MKDREFNIAFTNKRDNKIYTNKKYTWAAFSKMLEETKRTYETVAEYKKMSKKDKNNIKDVGGFVCGYLKNGKRNIDTIVNRSMITLDIDNNPINIWDTIELLFDFKIIMYSTHSHTPNNQRLRLVIPLDRDVTPEEYEAIARHIAWEIDNSMNIFDNTTYQVNRMMFLPSTPKDGEYIFKHQDGELLIADNILDKYMDWKDITTWPRAESEKDIKIRNSLNKAEDPLTKKGIIGAFCRTYSITEGINKFLKDIYVPGADETRYTYAEGSTTGGAIIYDDKFMFSHHSTDPVSNVLCNIFDLVRIHKFRNLDDEVKEGTPVNRLPSFTKMSEFASQDKRVKVQLGKERMEKAKEEFEVIDNEDNWLESLDLKNNGKYESTRKNVKLIIQNDPLIKNKIYYDTFEQMPKTKVALPWDNKEEFKDGHQWRDWDDSYLKSHLENCYDIKVSERVYTDAINMVFYEQSIHPVREYLNSLKWDGIYRLESLFIDYLGAQDTKYNRMVAKKTLVAAVKRVFEPGCKYEELPILVSSRQGIGKSTLIEKLGGKWYSDSLRLEYIKADIKKATEQTEGSWILELPDLKAISSKDADLVKGFLSGKEDKFRKAFDKRISKIARQFIIIGTTNNQEFLSDRTGNRRYLPVTVDVIKPKKDIFKMNEYDIGQIWSETVKYYKEGYSIYLNKEEKELAAEMQELYMFSSEEEEEFLKYINKPILKVKGMADWYSLTLAERINYLYPPDEFVEDNKAEDTRETEERIKICVVAVYDEFINPKYPSEYTSLTREVELNIKNMLIKAGWVKHTSKDRGKLNFGVYGKRVAYVKKH